MPRTPRQIPVADHLWDLYGRMAEEMGSDREALVNEAMHAFARLHGYLAPAAPPPEPAPAKAGEAQAGAGKADAEKADAAKVDAGKVDAGKVDAGKVDAGKVDAGKVDAAKVDAGNAARDRRAVTERVLDTAERLERDIAARPPPIPAPPPARPGGDATAPGAGPRPGILWLRREDGSVVEVDRDRFVIGRGGHCDLIIDSAKISREHAVFVRDAEGWWIEDLGSSNGTWYRGERVKRRRIVHGDEFFLCAEKLRCALR